MTVAIVTAAAIILLPPLAFWIGRMSLSRELASSKLALRIAADWINQQEPNFQWHWYDPTTGTITPKDAD